MIIAIDGPAGSGKTTIGKMIATRLGLPVVDTGLFYRAVTVEASRRKIQPEAVEALTEMIKQITISVNTDPHASAGLVTVDGRDVTRQALDPSLASRLARIASIPQVRRELAGLQRQAAGKAAVVLGRDIGTVIFPEAKPKFFLTASPAERMKRRRRELELASGRSAPDALLEEEVEAYEYFYVVEKVVICDYLK